MYKFIQRLVSVVSKKKLGLWLGCLLGLAITLGILGLRSMIVEPHAYVSDQASLPVGAIVKDPTIQFQVETVKPNNGGGNYFVNYRLKREQSRQEAKAMLLELLDSKVEKSQAQAQEKWLELSSKIQSEAEIENLLKIKGFQDVVADVFSEHVTVIVYAPSLTSDEVKTIKEIVGQVTNIRGENISISFLK